MANKTISQILATSNKQMKPAAKLANIKAIVKSTRAKYGNSKVKLAKPGKYNSTAGVVAIKYMNDEDKLAIIAIEVKSIKSAAIEATECTAGTVFEAEVTKLVATSVILSGINKSTTSAIL